MAAGDAAEHQAAPEPMLGKATLGFAGAIKPLNHLAANVDHLRVGVRAQPGQRVM